MSTRSVTTTCLAVLGCLSALLVLLLNFIAVDPFTLPGDNLIYFLPLIRAHTQEVLNGNLLTMLWEVGAGWNPFESAAVGLFYPINHLALLVAKALGNDLLMLEVSAFLHLWLAGILAFLLLPHRMQARTRLLLAILFILQPAPILLGRNWHIYLVGYPWFLGLALITWRALDGTISTGLRRAGWVGFGLLMFLGTHPQIYILGVLTLCAWILSESSNRAGIKLIFELGIAQLPAVAPLFYIKHLSSLAGANMMAGRGDSNFVLSFAQSGWTVSQGLILGNLVGSGGFHLWSGVSSMGIGMFFCPAWILALAFAIKRHKWLLILLLIIGFLGLGIGSFPWLRHFALGPLVGFRWTWKLTMLFCPLILLLVIRHWPEWLGSFKTRLYVGVGQGMAALLVICLGQEFDLLPSNAGAQVAGGVHGIINETKKALSTAGLPPGTRIAVIGGSGMADPLPLPLLGLMGMAPLLSEYESPNSYEPLEPANVAQLHFGLSVPWRVFISAQEYYNHPEEVESELCSIGVQGIVTRFPGLFSSGGTSNFRDSINRTTYLRVIGDTTPGTYPRAMVDRLAMPLLRLPGGTLSTTSDQIETAPRLDPPRPMVWTRASNGRWEARPHHIGWSWAVIEAACLLTMGLIFWRLTDASRPTMDAKGDPPSPPGSN